VRTRVRRSSRLPATYAAATATEGANAAILGCVASYSCREYAAHGRSTLPPPSSVSTATVTRSVADTASAEGNSSQADAVPLPRDTSRVQPTLTNDTAEACQPSAYPPGSTLAETALAEADCESPRMRISGKVPRNRRRCHGAEVGPGSVTTGAAVARIGRRKSAAAAAHGGAQSAGRRRTLTAVTPGGTDGAMKETRVAAGPLLAAFTVAEKKALPSPYWMATAVTGYGNAASRTESSSPPVSLAAAGEKVATVGTAAVYVYVNTAMEMFETVEMVTLATADGAPARSTVAVTRERAAAAGPIRTAVRVRQGTAGPHGREKTARSSPGVTPAGRRATTTAIDSPPTEGLQPSSVSESQQLMYTVHRLTATTAEIKGMKNTGGEFLECIKA
jgi:hypothetical protein